MDPTSVVRSLRDPARPTFLLGDVPPAEGTPPGKAQEICNKFVARSRNLASDGFVVYDIQAEEDRVTDMQRPFPFRKLSDPARYASLLSRSSGKPCVVYKCVADAAFEPWIENCAGVHGHRAVNVVGRSAGGAADAPQVGPSMQDAMAFVDKHHKIAFGCVCIAERHTAEYAASRGKPYPTEHENMIRKQEAGAEWFISQAVYDPAPMLALLHDYAAACRERGLQPRKVVLTFTPVSRAKTINFVKWLGVTIPEATEQAILAAAEANGGSVNKGVDKSVELLLECLDVILKGAAGIDVPLGISVESVSIYRSEINAVHDLFSKMQTMMLDAMQLPWKIQWFHIPKEQEARELLDQGFEGSQFGGSTAPSSPLLRSLAGPPATPGSLRPATPAPPALSDAPQRSVAPQGGGFMGISENVVMLALGAALVTAGVLLGRKSAPG